MNEDCVHTIYFDLQKYRVCNRFNGEDYSLLCKDLATFAINQGYQIVRNGFYVVGGLSAKNFPVADVFNTKVTLNVDNELHFVQKPFITMQ